jgi:hypothetical protein
VTAALTWVITQCPFPREHDLVVIAASEIQAGRLPSQPEPGDKYVGTILLILLVIFLLGGFSGRFGGYGYGYGHGGVGVIGTILIIVVVLMLLGRL